MDCYVHDIPGRLRVRTPHAKNNPANAAEIKSLLESVVGIDSTAVNTLTGSVIVNYNSKALQSRDILALLMEKGYVDITKAGGSNSSTQDAFSIAGGFIGKAILSIALDRMFKDSPLALLTVLI